MQMAISEPVWALGLMSGTSLDGIDAALIRTDGGRVAKEGPWLTLAYDSAIRERIRAAIGGQGDVPALERELTLLHAQAVEALLRTSGLPREEIRVIGFHGQTIAHRPQEGFTQQIGDGELLA